MITKSREHADLNDAIIYIFGYRSLKKNRGDGRASEEVVVMVKKSTSSGLHLFLEIHSSKLGDAWP